MCIENASEHSLLRIYGRINRLYYEINTPDFWTDGDEDKKCKDFINDCFVKGQKDGLLDFDFRESYLGKDLQNWMDVRCEAMNMDMGIAISWNTN